MNTLVQTRIDAKTKKEAEAIVNQLGISLNEAIRMFLNQVTIHKGIPFKPTLIAEENYTPNAKLKKIIDEVETGKNLTEYNNTNEMWEELGL